MENLNTLEKENLILEKIDFIYKNFSQILLSKEDFMQVIEQSLDPNIRDYLKDHTIKEYYTVQVNQYWEIIENDRVNQVKAEEKYKNVYEKLLLEHKKEN